MELSLGTADGQWPARGGAGMHKLRPPSEIIYRYSSSAFLGIVECPVTW